MKDLNLKLNKRRAHMEKKPSLWQQMGRKTPEEDEDEVAEQKPESSGFGWQGIKNMVGGKSAAELITEEAERRKRLKGG